MKSPCIKICMIDKNTEKCTGCGRTLEQIVRWQKYTDNERNEIMNRLRERHGHTCID